MRILQGAEGMKRISVRIIQSLNDYPGNMEPCQVEEVVIVGTQFLFTPIAAVCTCIVCLCIAVCCSSEKQWHFVH